jgi:hypothetical protein
MPAGEKKRQGQNSRSMPFWANTITTDQAESVIHCEGAEAEAYACDVASAA